MHCCDVIVINGDEQLKLLSVVLVTYIVNAYALLREKTVGVKSDAVNSVGEIVEQLPRDKPVIIVPANVFTWIVQAVPVVVTGSLGNTRKEPDGS